MKGLLRRLHGLLTLYGDQHPPPIPGAVHPSLRWRGARGSAAQMCLASPDPATSPLPQLVAWPFGDALSLPQAVQGLGSPIPVIPAPLTSSEAALPQGVPLHSQSLWCGGGSVGGGPPQPWRLKILQDGTHSGTSTTSLHPAATVAPTAGCWEEDEEGSSASLQGCSWGWLEVARSCLSAPT